MPYSASENGTIIEVHDLHKSYGSLKAVEGVSFSINAGEVFGILGPNGAGKTTTLEILEGVRAPDQGSARINGIDVREDPRGVREIIGIQLQSSSFFEKLSLSEILGVFGDLGGFQDFLFFLPERIADESIGKNRSGQAVPDSRCLQAA